MKYFTIQIKDVRFFIKTEKTKRNKTDAKRILDLYVKFKNSSYENYTEIMIEKSIEQIKYIMELCEIKLYDNCIAYHCQYSGGVTGEIAEFQENNYYITK